MNDPIQTVDRSNQFSENDYERELLEALFGRLVLGQTH